MGQAGAAVPLLIWQFASKQAREGLEARHCFLARLREYTGSDASEDAARVIFTELVTNVMRHAPGRITITLEVEESVAILKIEDGGPGFDFVPRLPANPFCEGGRGLFIVAQYASDVRVERHSNSGTLVSARFPVNGIQVNY